jgi:hypothetical protein
VPATTITVKVEDELLALDRGVLAQHRSDAVALHLQDERES